MNYPLTALALLSLTASAGAQETRQLDAHEHGVSTAEIVVDDDRLIIDLYAPGMDIVGFEYQAATDEDRAAVAQAVMQLTRAEEIVTVGEAAGCLLIEVLAHLHGDEHEHDGTHEHVEGDGEDHGEDHGDEHGDEHGEEADHDAAEDHGEETAREDGSHSEFHARYTYDCTDTAPLSSIDFPFFEAFQNAVEIEARYVTAAGGGSAELERGSTTLSLD